MTPREEQLLLLQRALESFALSAEGSFPLTLQTAVPVAEGLLWYLDAHNWSLVYDAERTARTVEGTIATAGPLPEGPPARPPQRLDLNQ